MKKRNSARKHLFTALLIGGIFMTGASVAHAQSDGGHIGSGVGRDGGLLGSGVGRDGGGGGTIGSGTRTEDDGGGGTIGSGTRTEDDGGGTIGSGTRSNQMGSGAGLSEENGGWLASVWKFFF